jgi:hypothetical protein
MEEARSVLVRLDRIAALDEARAPAAVLLDEVRELMHEAEAWLASEPRSVRCEPAEAVERCRAALEGVLLGR